MIKNILKLFCKLVVVASIVSAVLGVIYYFSDRKNDYIEIYNDDYDYDADDYDIEETFVL